MLRNGRQVVFQDRRKVVDSRCLLRIICIMSNCDDTGIQKSRRICETYARHLCTANLFLGFAIIRQ